MISPRPRVGPGLTSAQISNIHAGEGWRSHSIISAAPRGVIACLGYRGYEAALRAGGDGHRDVGAQGLAPLQGKGLDPLRDLVQDSNI